MWVNQPVNGLNGNSICTGWYDLSEHNLHHNNKLVVTAANKWAINEQMADSSSKEAKIVRSADY